MYRKCNLILYVANEIRYLKICTDMFLLQKLVLAKFTMGNKLITVCL